MIPAVSIAGFSDELVKIAKAKEQPIDVEAIKRKVELWSRLKSSTDVPIHEEHGDANEYGGGFYDTTTKSIGVGAGRDHESLAHELGHADLDQGLLGKVIQHRLLHGLFPLTPIAGALGGMLLSKGKNWGALLPIATAAPTLLAEWLATRKGARRLEEVGATPEEMAAYRKNLGDSFATYHGVIPETLLAGGAGYAVGRMGQS